MSLDSWDIAWSRAFYSAETPEELVIFGDLYRKLRLQVWGERADESLIPTTLRKTSFYTY